VTAENLQDVAWRASVNDGQSHSPQSAAARFNAAHELPFDVEGPARLRAGVVNSMRLSQSSYCVQVYPIDLPQWGLDGRRATQTWENLHASYIEAN